MARRLHPYGPYEPCLWCGGSFYGPKKPLYHLGQRVQVRADCTFGGVLSVQAGQQGIIISINPTDTKSRYLVRFNDKPNPMQGGDWWADRDLLPVQGDNA